MKFGLEYCSATREPNDPPVRTLDRVNVGTEVMLAPA